MEKTASEIVKVKKTVRLQEWERQIEEQKTSGLSVQEWCRQNGIATKTYYYHLRKVREDFFKAIPHKDSAADALSDFSSDCTEIPKAY